MTDLRTGYTTGTCAAAAAKAAATVLSGKQIDDRVTIELPDGSKASLPVLYAKLQGQNATAAVRKDAGDDPDITDKALIEATLAFNDKKQIVFLAGDGVGIVTKPGLQVPTGQPAINPVPRQMIQKAIRTVTQKGVDVTISVPGGKELAEKTFNPKLGILGGISIIGTSGRVRPFSVPALREALKCSLDIARAAGIIAPVYLPGHIGKKAAQKHFTLKPDQIIEVSNEWGYMLDRLKDYDFQHLLAMGHPGKLVKLAEGNFDTHSSRSESAVGFIEKTAKDLIGKDFSSAVTTEAIFQDLDRKQRKILADTLAEKIKGSITEKINFKPEKIAVVLTDMQGEILGCAGDTTPWK